MTAGVPHTPRLLLCGLMAVLMLSGACTRRSDSMPVQAVPTAPPPPQSDPERHPPPPPPRAKADAVDPDACQQARAVVKRLQRQAADGCSADNPCLVDRDCLLRTTNANVTEIQDARTAMEGICPGSIDRLSCAEAPATCTDGRCVSPPEAR